MAEHLHQALAIAPTAHRARAEDHHERHSPPLGLRRVAPDGLFHQLGAVHDVHDVGLQYESARLQAADVEHDVDQAQQMLAAARNLVDM